MRKAVRRGWDAWWVRYYTLRLLHFQIKAQERAAQLAEVERLRAKLTPAESIPAKVVTADPRLLAAMNKAGVKVTRELVQDVASKLADNELGAAASTLLQDIEALAEQQPCKRQPRRRRRAWKKAAKQPLSNAAKGAMHDKIRAPHRPSGKIMPRPRWAHDEEPMGGWDLGDLVIQTGVGVEMSEDEKLARIMEHMEPVSDAEPERRPQRRKLVPPTPQRPVSRCRRVLPWMRTRLAKPLLRCSRPA